MLTAECYKRRLEKGLTFLEFNYMLMQSYDFLELNRRYGCKLEMGGDDQWSNILGGADLIRRKEKKEAYGLTCTLLLKSDGNKMGKNAQYRGCRRPQLPGTADLPAHGGSGAAGRAQR